MSPRSWLIYFRTLSCRSNGSINYTAWTIVRLPVSLGNRAEWRATNLFWVPIKSRTTTIELVFKLKKLNFSLHLKQFGVNLTKISGKRVWRDWSDPFLNRFFFSFCLRERRVQETTGRNESERRVEERGDTKASQKTWHPLPTLSTSPPPRTPPAPDLLTHATVWLSFINTYMKSLAEDHDSIKHPWFDQSGGSQIWTKTRKDLILLQHNLTLAPNFSPSVTTILPYIVETWDEGNGVLAMEFKSFYSEIHDTQVDVLHQDVSVHQSSVLVTS